MTKPAEPRKKKPYTPPRLKRYGDLRTITRGNVSRKNEGAGLPKTKASGSG